MADNFRPLQAQNFTLAGAGSSISDTSLILSSMTTIDGVDIAMTDVGSTGYFTLEPGNGTQEEAGTFTGITQNVNGTATLTGVKHQLFEYPYTQTAGLTKSHAGGTSLVLSNTAGFYESISGKANDETVTGVWTFPDTEAGRARITSDTDTAVDTAFVTFGQLSRQAIGGAAKATNTVYGISKLSSAAIIATQPIVLNAEEVSVTGGTSYVVRANTSGKIDPTYLNGTETYTWGGTQTFSGTVNINNTVNMNGSTIMVASPSISGTAILTAGKVVSLDSSAKLPAIDGSQLTNIIRIIAASDTLIFSKDGETTNTDAGSVILNSIYIGISGTYRVSFEAKRTSSGITVTLTGGSTHNITTSYATYTADVYVLAGQSITITGAPGGNTVNTRNFRLYGYLTSGIIYAQ